jgi:hypothetical protein
MTALSDDELWNAFQSATLPASHWTHHAHLRVAWMYSRKHSLDEAHILMRVGIIRLNATHGLVETPTRGYHETMTRVWLALVAAAIRKTPELASSTEFLDAHAEDLVTVAPLRHYSRQRLTSAEARAVFVQPDLVPLP